MKLVLFHRYIVNANDDGSIPMNAKCYAEIDEEDRKKVVSALEGQPELKTDEDIVAWLSLLAVDWEKPRE